MQNTIILIYFTDNFYVPNIYLFLYTLYIVFNTVYCAGVKNVALYQHNHFKSTFRSAMITSTKYNKFPVKVKHKIIVSRPC